MKLTLLLGAAATFGGHAAAFYGQMAASDYIYLDGGVEQYVYLTDYNTGSTYSGLFSPGFNGCVEKECGATFDETSPPYTYKFFAKVWRTENGCHNIDFQGAFDSGHGYCCGSLPCDFTA